MKPLAWIATSLVIVQLAHADAPTAMGNVDIVEKLGDQVPLGLHFFDSMGQPVTLRHYLSGRPLVLTLVYYRCPLLCTRLLGGLTKTMRELPWRVGREYDAVTVSIDEDETPALAATARAGFLQSLGQATPPPAWAFLTGHAVEVDALAEAVGFRFHRIEGRREMAHAAAVFVLTPDGHISRYLYGIDFPPRQLEAALFEAADGRVGTSFERLILRCYRYDPATKTFAVFIGRYFRVGGVVLILAMSGLILALWRRDRQRQAKRAP